MMPLLEPGRTKQARMWIYMGDTDHPYNVFDFTTSRARDGPKQFLKNFRPTLLADAYGGYDGIRDVRKGHLTQAYAVFLARWARRLSWREVALVFRTTWDNVFRSVAWVVEYGLQYRCLEGITAIGVDEVQFQKGHRYLTVVYQIDASCRRLLWIGQDRTVKTLLRFFRMLGPQRTAALQFVCSDIWQPYLEKGVAVEFVEDHLGAIPSG